MDSEVTTTTDSFEVQATVQVHCGNNVLKGGDNPFNCSYGSRGGWNLSRKSKWASSGWWHCRVIRTWNGEQQKLCIEGRGGIIIVRPRQPATPVRDGGGGRDERESAHL
jgi:hypothetical protein